MIGSRLVSRRRSCWDALGGVPPRKSPQVNLARYRATLDSRKPRWEENMTRRAPLPALNDVPLQCQTPQSFRFPLLIVSRLAHLLTHRHRDTDTESSRAFSYPADGHITLRSAEGRQWMRFKPEPQSSCACDDTLLLRSRHHSRQVSDAALDVDENS